MVNLPAKLKWHLETAKSAKARKTGHSTAAIAIELLLAVPLRLGNLCALHLDRNFIKVGSRVHLVIPKQDVKNRRDLEFELPQHTISLLEWFVNNHRKADCQNRYLFASAGLTHKGLNTLRMQIMGAVKAFTGLTVHPHLFRHLAASIYLSENPGGHEVLKQILGHRSIATTMRFYAAQMDRKAHQHFSKTVHKLRDSSFDTAAGEREKP